MITEVCELCANFFESPFKRVRIGPRFVSRCRTNPDDSSHSLKLWTAIPGVSRIEALARPAVDCRGGSWSPDGSETYIPPEAEHEIARIADALQREVRLVEAAAGELERVSK